MTMTKVRSEEKTVSEVTTKKTILTTVTSSQVTWLFGIDDTTLKQWINRGVLTPCSNTNKAIDRFWREDIAELLAAFGA